jgi:tRNA-modifying protein YgfZ
MTRKSAFLEDRGVVRVSGEEAAGFLQNLLTNDVETLGLNEARYAALLTPQGKILFDFLVVRAPAETGVAYLLDCDGARAADLAKRLSIYKLRAKVAVADESADYGVVATWSGEAEDAPSGIVYRDPCAASLGLRAILPRADALAVGGGEVGAYEAVRIGLGAPKGGVDFAYGDAFPHDADMDWFGGVDFGKGCYVGQEVVSRMKHRGGARKRVVRVRLDGLPPATGAEITDGERPLGVLGSSSGRDALALLRLDRVEEAAAAGRSLSAAGVGLALVKDERV